MAKPISDKVIEKELDRPNSPSEESADSGSDKDVSARRREQKEEMKGAVVAVAGNSSYSSSTSSSSSSSSSSSIRLSLPGVRSPPHCMRLLRRPRRRREMRK